MKVMKKLLLGRGSVPFVGVLLALSGMAAAQSNQPVLVTAPVEKAFIPSGFDDNDDVEVILHGHFPNTCYKVGPATATVDYATGTVTVDAKAYYYRGAGCAQVLVSFTQSVKIGTLRRGSYDVKVVDRPGTITVPLVIAYAQTANPDDYLYAPVALVALDEPIPGQYAVRIEGEYPFMFIGCMVMREVRAYMSPGNALVVLPIAELADDGPDCEPQAASKKFSFTKPVGALDAGEYLIHVRVLEGNSLNRFMSLDL